MRQKEISLNGKSDLTARDIVNVLMDTVELLYDSVYVGLFGHAPDIDIELTYGEKHGYETLEIELILDENILPFYVNTENIQDIDIIKNIDKLFFTELKKLNELYKK